MLLPILGLCTLYVYVFVYVSYIIVVVFMPPYWCGNSYVGVVYGFLCILSCLASVMVPMLGLNTLDNCFLTVICY